MAITGSPAVIVKEQDLSSYVSADSVTTGAVVGNFEWGPAESITKISSEGKLTQFFGRPYDWNYKDWFTAKNYLQYSSSLAVVRAVSEDSLNASDTGVGYLQKNYETLEFNLHDNNVGGIEKMGIINSGISILARYPGSLGNRITVSFMNSSAKKLYEDRKAGGEEVTKNRVYDLLSRPLKDTEIFLGVFVDEELQEVGIFSLEDGSTDITGYGNYLFKYFNNNSNWIYLIKENFKCKEVIKDKETGRITETVRKLYANGVPNLYYYDVKNDKQKQNPLLVCIEGDITLSGAELSPIEELPFSSYQNAWKLFENEETDEANVQLLMQGGGNIELGNLIITLAGTRKDCVACVSPMLDEVVNTLTPTDNIAKGSGSAYQGSSYAFMDGNYKYQYDNYNDVYRWIPLNGDIAGIMAQTDNEEQPWMSPGGKQIKNCVKLAFHPTKAERDILFSYNINPVTNFRAEGNILWGDWTRIDNTAFNFIGVRRLFLYIERAIKNYARNVMWKQNDEITETIFIQTVEPFLNDVVGGRGIQEFGIYAGSKVTSPDEMDRGIFRAKIIIKPVRSIRYVELVFTAVRSDMSIEEIVQ